MDEKRLRDVLAESAAEFVAAEVWTSSPVGNSFTRRWAIDRSDAVDAEQFLKLYTSADNWKGDPEDRFYCVTNPQVSEGAREGLYRGGRVSAKVEVDPADESETWYVYQELREGLVRTVKDASGAFDFSGFVLGNDKQFIHGGSANLLLRLPNVDPAKQQAIAAELKTQEVFTDIVSTYDQYAGEWRSVYAEGKPEEDGSVSILLYLTNSVNQDYYFWMMSGASTVEGHYLKFGTNEALIQSFLSTVYFKADGQLDTDDPVAVTSKTLQESQPGRSTPARVTLDTDTRLLNVEFVITWQAGSKIADAATVSGEDRVFTDPAVSVPRQGTSTVSQWWERGENTADLPAKPANLYDGDNGTWAEEYMMQSPPDILPNGKYNWLLACKRTELPAAMLDAGLPRWIPQAKQSKTNKELNTISISGQQVMRLMNGLVDETAESYITWDDDWDWVTGSTCVEDAVLCHNEVWWKCIVATTTDEPSYSSADWEVTVDAPAGWAALTDEDWSANYVRTYVDTFSSDPIPWDSTWCDYEGETENSSATWQALFGAGLWHAAFSVNPTTNDLCWVNTTQLAGALSSPYWGDNTLRFTVGTAQVYSDGFPTYTLSVTGSDTGFAAFLTASAGSMMSWDGRTVVKCDNGRWRILFEPDTTYSLNTYWEWSQGSTTEEYVRSNGAAYLMSTYPQYITLVNRVSACGSNKNFGTVEYAEGIYSNEPATWVFAEERIGEENGYPYKATSGAPVTIYIRDIDLEPTDGGTTVLPRFGYTADRYSNPNLLEVFRRTRQRIDTEVFRKYSAVHPAMLSSLDAFIPAAFTDSVGQTFPSDGFWFDSNTLIKFRSSDGGVQMSGAMFYYVEMMIEHYGEKEADVQETSARDGTLRNAAVDPDTGLGMVYSSPQELTANYDGETLKSSQTRREYSKYGVTSEMINPFEIRDT